jgi:hypothetical protein
LGSTLWRLEGQLMVTTMVKLTMALVPDSPMALETPAPLRLSDQHDAGNPLSSAIGVRETAPMLQRVDVFLTGHAYPIPGQGEVLTRLAVVSEHAMLLDKTLLVRGPLDASGVPQPFERMKLGYENAYGGIGFSDNPLGVGYGTNEAPSIVYPEGPIERAAGFGPIPASFSARRKLLGKLPRNALTGRIAEIPLDFDWRYFQAAPLDQQVNQLRGSEWLIVEGLSPEHERLCSQLPCAVAVARVYGAERAGVPDAVPLRIDMVHVDLDNERCNVVWRGSFPVGGEEALGELVIAGNVELPERPVEWPVDESALAAAGTVGPTLVEPPTPRMANRRGAQRDDALRATRVMAPQDHMRAEGPPERRRGELDETVAVDPARVPQAATPFRSAGQPAPERPAPERRAPQRPAAEHPAAERPAAERRAPRPAAGVPAAGVRAPRHPLVETRPVKSGALKVPISPFDLAPVGETRDGPAIPGAPWSNVAAPVVPVPSKHLKRTAISAVEALAVLRSSGTDWSSTLASAALAPSDSDARADETNRLEAEREAADQARRDEEQARREAEERRREADERRKEEELRFQREQEEARTARERRSREAAKAKEDAAQKLRTAMYDGFKRKP